MGKMKVAKKADIYLSTKQNKLASLLGKGSPLSDRDDVAELGGVELTFG